MAKYNKHVSLKKKIIKRTIYHVDGTKGEISCSIKYNTKSDRYDFRIGEDFILSNICFIYCMRWAEKYNITWQDVSKSTM